MRLEFDDAIEIPRRPHAAAWCGRAAGACAFRRPDRGPGAIRRPLAGAGIGRPSARPDPRGNTGRPGGGGPRARVARALPTPRPVERAAPDSTLPAGADAPGRGR